MRTGWQCGRIVLAALVLGSGELNLSGATMVRTGTRLLADKLDRSQCYFGTNGVGDCLTMCGTWTPEQVHRLAQCCRESGCRFSAAEFMDRLTGKVKPGYSNSMERVLAFLKSGQDVFEASPLFHESGGVMYYWPWSVVSNAAMALPTVRTYSGGRYWTETRLREGLASARVAGIPSPYFSIEASFGLFSELLKAGYDRVDVEVIFGRDQERCYSGVKTAMEAFGRGKGFGADMAMEWYGGGEHDALWWHRWRTSLYHAYLRGADPIYIESALEGFTAHGQCKDFDHPETVRFRQVFCAFAEWVRTHPRADGLPKSVVGAIQGRNDGYIGGFQTHLYGQRNDDAFLLTEADRQSWSIFDGLYRRGAWQDPEASGESDFSGNPPLGMAGILPYDAPDELWTDYRLLFFLGRNTMDDALYERLVRYVENGGVLILNVSHMDVADRPGVAFQPYNDGDWTRLLGVKCVSGQVSRVLCGVKFTETPMCFGTFQPVLPACDPKFPDGGFTVPRLEVTTARRFAVASDRFNDESFASDMPSVLFCNRKGRGFVVLLASSEPPGAAGVCGLYSLLIKKALEKVDVWPKVVCSDTVRWSVYGDGTVYVLNTEKDLVQEILLKRSAYDEWVRLNLSPGELCVVP